MALKNHKNLTNKKAASPIDKHAYYIEAVQSVEHDAWLYRDFFRQARKCDPRSLREDFCGTHALACEWVKLHLDNTALALDLDPAPLEYGRTHAETTLTPHQHDRLEVRQESVTKKTRPVDLIVAGNFSFNIFKKRQELLTYFKQARKSLRAGRGMLVLDVTGGPSMIELGKESRKVRSKSLGTYTYTWECKSFDPITHDAQYAIHFDIPGRKRVRDAFTYDWRLWSIPELRELLEEAGFSKTIVYWDVAEGPKDENFRISEQGDPHEGWIAYVAGLA
jgi:hypothetical protein